MAALRADQTAARANALAGWDGAAPGDLAVRREFTMPTAFPG
jgi:hypothetical protein